jgi:hypothetical protein
LVESSSDAASGGAAGHRVAIRARKWCGDAQQAQRAPAKVADAHAPFVPTTTRYFGDLFDTPRCEIRVILGFAEGTGVQRFGCSLVAVSARSSLLFHGHRCEPNSCCSLRSLARLPFASSRDCFVVCFMGPLLVGRGCGRGRDSGRAGRSSATPFAGCQHEAQRVTLPRGARFECGGTSSALHAVRLSVLRGLEGDASAARSEHR